MFFLLAFVLGMAGLALLIAGEFSWLGGKKIPARTGRQIGAVLVSFLPLALGARLLLHRLDPEEAVEPAVVYGLVAGLVVVTAVVLLIRAVRAQGRRPGRPAPSSPAGNRFEGVSAGDFSAANEPVEAPPWTPPPVAAPKKKPRPGAAKDPFDFG